MKIKDLLSRPLRDGPGGRGRDLVWVCDRGNCVKSLAPTGPRSPSGP